MAQNTSHATQRDLLRQVLPDDLAHIDSRAELRSMLAEKYSVAPNLIIIHNDRRYSIFYNGKPKPDFKLIERIRRCKEQKEEKERAKEERLRRRAERQQARKNNKKVVATITLETETTIVAAVDLKTLVYRKDRGAVRTYRTPEWKYLSQSLPEIDDRLLWHACHDDGLRDLLIACANVAEDLLSKSPEGYLYADALRNNRYFAKLLKLDDGQALMARVIRCVDLTYEEGTRTQRYTLGPAIPYLLRLQEYFNVANPTMERTTEVFNEAQKKWAATKGYDTVVIGGFVYAAVSNRFYNKLSNSKLPLLVRRLRAMGFSVDSDNITQVDIEASLPTEMNLLACRLDGRIKRPTTSEIKAARNRTAKQFNIPLKLAKAIHAASLCGSLIGIESEVWEGYDIDLDTKLAIASSEEVIENRRIFEQNYDLFERHGMFDSSPDKNSKKKSSHYFLLYAELERKRMAPLLRYLEEDNILFVAKHDGVDIFSSLTEQQKDQIRQMLGIACSIKTISLKNNTDHHCSAATHFEKQNAEGEAQYVVEQLSVLLPVYAPFRGIIRGSPP